MDRNLVKKYLFKLEKDAEFGAVNSDNLEYRKKFTEIGNIIHRVSQATDWDKTLKMDKFPYRAYMVKLIHDAQFAFDLADRPADSDRFANIIDYISDVLADEDSYKISNEQYESKGYMAKIRDCEPPV